MKFLATSILALSAAAILPQNVNAQTPFPEGEGRDMIMQACSQCHSIGKIVQAELTTEDWAFIVNDMVARGAPVHVEQLDAVTSYLQEHFGKRQE